MRRSSKLGTISPVGGGLRVRVVTLGCSRSFSDMSRNRSATAPARPQVVYKCRNRSSPEKASCES